MQRNARNINIRRNAPQIKIRNNRVPNARRSQRMSRIIPASRTCVHKVNVERKNQANKKMPLITKIIFATIFIALILLGVKFGSAELIRSNIENSLIATGSRIDVKKISFQPLSNKIVLNDVVVYAPKGFKEDIFLRIKEVAVKMNTKSMISPNMEIYEIELIDFEVMYEKNEEDSNIDLLIENIHDASRRMRHRKNVKIDALILTSGIIENNGLDWNKLVVEDYHNNDLFTRYNTLGIIERILTIIKNSLSSSQSVKKE